MPIISVIVPVYKVEQYLSACVESILSQTFTDFELILVDDGSPDRCGEICDTYAERDPRVTVIHRKNGGLSAARNSGIDVVQGEYLTFVDSDDLVSADYLSVLLWEAKRHNADIAVCQLRRFKQKPPTAPICYDPGEVTTVSHVQSVCMLYQGDARNPVNACAKLFSVHTIGTLRFPEGKLHEDQAFVPIACYHARKIALIPVKPYYYRDRANSITSEEFSIRRYDDIWAIDQCMEYFQRMGEEEILAAAQEKRQRVLCSYAILAKAAGVEVPLEYRISSGKALRYLRKHASDEKYTYYLSLLHPKRVRPHAYYYRIMQAFIRRKN